MNDTPQPETTRAAAFFADRPATIARLRADSARLQAMAEQREREGCPLRAAMLRRDATVCSNLANANEIGWKP